jgi:hypothetical protein
LVIGRRSVLGRARVVSRSARRREAIEHYVVEDREEVGNHLKRSLIWAICAEIAAVVHRVALSLVIAYGEPVRSLRGV